MVKYFTLILTTIIIVSLHGCDLNHVAEKEFIHRTADIKIIDTLSVPQFKFQSIEFDLFYSNFIKDSIFQMKHIKFPLGGYYIDHQGKKPWDKSKWNLIKWDLRKDFYYPLDSNLLIEGKNFIKYENIIKEIGKIFELKFSKIEGEWYLEYYWMNNEY